MQYLMVVWFGYCGIRFGFWWMMDDGRRVNAQKGRRVAGQTEPLKNESSNAKTDYTKTHSL